MDSRPGDFADQRCQERVVGAPQNQRIRAAFDQWKHVALNERSGLRAGEIARFDLFDPPFAGLRQDLYASGKAFL